jgi:glycosyltransferase involved in cell wall biosynthesis
MRPSCPVKIAVLIPCYNEEVTIAEVVRDFKSELPMADVYVFDNGSTDRTAQMASEAGAIVRREQRRGKGYVVQAMFRLCHFSASAKLKRATLRSV